MMTGFIGHKVDGTNFIFKPSSKALFFADVKQDMVHILVNTVNSINH